MSGTDKIEIPDRLLQRLSVNDTGFLQRVYSDGLEKYRERLARIGFVRVGKNSRCRLWIWTMDICNGADLKARCWY